MMASPSIALPSRRRLVAATFIALVLGVGAAIPVILAPSGEIPAPPPLLVGSVAPAEIANATSAALRQDATSIVLAAGVPTDYLVFLRAGDALAYAWTAATPIAFELHAHDIVAAAPGAAQTAFEAGTANSGNGYLIGPADGFYGWYVAADATTRVELRLSGFYDLTPGLVPP